MPIPGCRQVVASMVMIFEFLHAAIKRLKSRHPQFKVQSTTGIVEWGSISSPCRFNTPTQIWFLETTLTTDTLLGKPSLLNNRCRITWLSLPFCHYSWMYITVTDKKNTCNWNQFISLRFFSKLVGPDKLRLIALLINLAANTNFRIRVASILKTQKKPRSYSWSID